MEKVFKLGAHIEMLPEGIALDAAEGIDKKYVSSIHEVIDDETLVITNPMQKARLVPMHPGETYNVYFFVNLKIYEAEAVVVKNVSDGRFRNVKIRLNKQPKKYERRQFFRLETTMDLAYLHLTAENSSLFKIAVQKNALLQMDGFKKGTTLDVSGGGVRYTSEEQLPVGGLLIIHIIGEQEGGRKNYIFLGKVLKSERIEGVRGLFEHRVQFIDLKLDLREEFIQYIFKCEREKLNNRSGLR